VHFYHQISERELFEICTQHLDDIVFILSVIEQWIEDHPEKIDRSL